MKNNRLIGSLIIGISGLIGLIIYFFNRTLTDIVSTSCTHGPTCSMWGTIGFQTNVGLGIMIFVLLIGLYILLFTKEKNPKAEQKENNEKVLNKLNEEEKQIIAKIIESEGSIYQSDLIKKTGLSKVKITRILDKIEGKGLINRQRRGMTNVIILKNK